MPPAAVSAPRLGHHHQASAKPVAPCRAQQRGVSALVCRAQAGDGLIGPIVSGPIAVNPVITPASDPVTAASEARPAKPVDRSKGLWTRCDKCGTILYIKHLKEHHHICFGCNYHLKMSSQERVDHLIDAGTWRPMDETLSPVDPLEFTDLKVRGCKASFPCVVGRWAGGVHARGGATRMAGDGGEMALHGGCILHVAGSSSETLHEGDCMSDPAEHTGGHGPAPKAPMWVGATASHMVAVAQMCRCGPRPMRFRFRSWRAKLRLG